MPRLLAVLLLLDLLPVAQHRRGVLRVDVAEDVRVAVDELVGDGVGDFVEGEAAFLLGHHALEHHLQEHVAKLLDVVRALVGAVHRREQLVCFLQKARLQGGEGLLPVPGAALFRIPQPDHYFMQPFDSVHGGDYTKNGGVWPSRGQSRQSGWLGMQHSRWIWRSPCISSPLDE